MQERGLSGELAKRTKALALRIIRLYTSLPKTQPARIIAVQLLRSGTSVGANYREASVARSKAEFAAKLGLVEQELRETEYWIDLLLEAGIVKPARLLPLRAELAELCAMTVASRKTAGKRPAVSG